jgi:hypothetical protein
VIQLPRIDVILPALRQEIFELAASLDETINRKSITSVVRLSPEKGPEKYVEIMEVVFADSPATSLRPLLGGNGPDPEYSESLRSRIKTLCENAKIETAFLNPLAMSKLFTESLVNVHGAAIDAYGMTIVEGAAFGAIPLLHAPHLFVDDDSRKAVIYAPIYAPLFAPLIESSTLSTPIAQFVSRSNGYFTLHVDQNRFDENTVSMLMQLPLPPIGASCLFESHTLPCFLASDFERFTPGEIANELKQIVHPSNHAKLASLAGECRKVAVSWCEGHNAESIMQSILF